MQFKLFGADAHTVFCKNKKNPFSTAYSPKMKTLTNPFFTFTRHLKRQAVKHVENVITQQCDELCSTAQ